MRKRLEGEGCRRTLLRNEECGTLKCCAWLEVSHCKRSDTPCHPFARVSYRKQTKVALKRCHTFRERAVCVPDESAGAESRDFGMQIAGSTDIPRLRSGQGSVCATGTSHCFLIDTLAIRNRSIPQKTPHLIFSNRHKYGRFFRPSFSRQQFRIARLRQGPSAPLRTFGCGGQARLESEAAVPMQDRDADGALRKRRGTENPTLTNRGWGTRKGEMI